MAKSKFPFTPAMLFVIAFIARLVIGLMSKKIEIPAEEQTLFLAFYGGLFTSIASLIILTYAALKRPELLFHALTFSAGFGIAGRIVEIVNGREVLFELVFLATQLAVMVCAYHYFAKWIARKNVKHDPDSSESETPDNK